MDFSRYDHSYRSPQISQSLHEECRISMPISQLAMEYGKLLRELQKGETAGDPVDLNKYNSFHSIDLKRTEMSFIKKETVVKAMKEKILGNPSQRYVLSGGKVLTIYRRSFVLGGLYRLYLFIYCSQCKYMIISCFVVYHYTVQYIRVLGIQFFLYVPQFQHSFNSKFINQGWLTLQISLIVIVEVPYPFCRLDHFSGCQVHQCAVDCTPDLIVLYANF